VQNVTTVNLRRVVHVFTAAEVGQSMQKHGIMPSDMPQQNLVCEKAAQAAQSALAQLIQTPPRRPN